MGGKCVLLLPQTECWACCKGSPTQEKTVGKWGQSLTFTIDTSEARDEDGGAEMDARQREPEHTAQLVLDVAAVHGATVDTSMQVAEDSVLVPQMNETDSANEIEIA